MATNEHASNLQAAKDDGKLPSYSQARDDLHAKNDDELRALAEAAGIDGVVHMTRQHLIESLIEEPGANEA
jgi:hypothetical protein